MQTFETVITGLGLIALALIAVGGIWALCQLEDPEYEDDKQDDLPANW